MASISKLLDLEMAAYILGLIWERVRFLPPFHDDFNFKFYFHKCHYFKIHLNIQNSLFWCCEDRGG